jgi:hypothetical protein
VTVLRGFRRAEEKFTEAAVWYESKHDGDTT